MAARYKFEDEKGREVVGAVYRKRGDELLRVEAAEEEELRFEPMNWHQLEELVRKLSRAGRLQLATAAAAELHRLAQARQLLLEVGYTPNADGTYTLPETVAAACGAGRGAGRQAGA